MLSWSKGKNVDELEMSTPSPLSQAVTTHAPVSVPTTISSAMKENKHSQLNISFLAGIPQYKLGTPSL